MATEYPVLCSVVTIVAGANVIRFSEDGGADVFDVTVLPGAYFVDGDDAVTDSLLYAFKIALDSASSSSGSSLTYGVSYAAKTTPGAVTGTVTIDASASADSNILGTHPNTTFPLHLLGFVDGADAGDADPLVAPNSPSPNWVSNQPAIKPDPQPPTQEGVSEHFTAGGQSYVFVNGADVDMWTEELEHISDDRTWTARALAADPYRSFETFWRLVKDGRRIRLYHRAMSSTAGSLETLTSAYLRGTYVLTGDALRQMPAPAEVEASRLFAFRVPLREYKA